MEIRKMECFEGLSDWRLSVSVLMESWPCGRSKRHPLRSVISFELLRIAAARSALTIAA
jgi:hypothetical protein